MLIHSLAFSICNIGTKASFYDVNNAAENDGSTGKFSCQGSAIPDSNLYAAVASSCFESSMCGKTATLAYKGKTIQVPILDECASCDAGQIDLSSTSWKMLEPNTAVGILDLQWNFGGSAPIKPETPPAPPAGKSQSASPASEVKIMKATNETPELAHVPSHTPVTAADNSASDASPSSNSTFPSNSTDASPSDSSGNTTSHIVNTTAEAGSLQTNPTNKHPKSTKHSKGTYSNAVFAASSLTLSSVFSIII